MFGIVEVIPATTRVDKHWLQWAKEKKGREKVEAGNMDNHFEFSCKEKARWKKLRRGEINGNVCVSV